MSFFLLPSNLLIVLWTVCLLACILRPTNNFVRRTCMGVSVVFAVILWSPLSQWISSPLERAFPPHTQNTDRTLRYIVHLSGAERPSIARQRQDIRLNDQLGRYLEVLRLSQMYPDTPILFSGGHSTNKSSDLEIAASVYAAFGIKQRAIFLGGAKDTCDNAREVASFLQANDQTGAILLVTSAMHMPRSLLCFQAYNQPAIPAPAPPITTQAKSFSAWLKRPLDSRKLRHLDLALHEWLGLVAYRLDGRISALWPMPEPALRDAEKASNNAP